MKKGDDSEETVGSTSQAGPMIILVGPSGAGKSSLLEALLKEYGTRLKDTTTYTTRSMRTGESEGIPYHFVDRARFEALIKEDFFVEWARVHDNLYGTPYDQIYEAWKNGQAIIMDVDVQGAKTFKKKFPQSLSVFIEPPSIDIMCQRIEKRDGHVPKDLEVRLQSARKELAQKQDFDRHLINDDFSETYAQLKKIIEEYLKSA